MNDSFEFLLSSPNGDHWTIRTTDNASDKHLKALDCIDLSEPVVEGDEGCNAYRIDPDDIPALEKGLARHGIKRITASDAMARLIANHCRAEKQVQKLKQQFKRHTNSAINKAIMERNIPELLRLDGLMLGSGGRQKLRERARVAFPELTHEYVKFSNLHRVTIHWGDEEHRAAFIDVTKDRHIRPLNWTGFFGIPHDADEYVSGGHLTLMTWPSDTNLIMDEGMNPLDGFALWNYTRGSWDHLSEQNCKMILKELNM